MCFVDTHISSSTRDALLFDDGQLIESNLRDEPRHSCRLTHIPHHTRSTLNQSQKIYFTQIALPVQHGTTGLYNLNSSPRMSPRVNDNKPCRRCIWRQLKKEVWVELLNSRISWIKAITVFSGCIWRRRSVLYSSTRPLALCIDLESFNMLHYKLFCLK